MRPKIVPFKFRKKHTETKGKITKSKKITKIFLMIFYQEPNQKNI